MDKSLLFIYCGIASRELLFLLTLQILFMIYLFKNVFEEVLVLQNCESHK